jgi:hypothetical protein
MAGLGKTRNRLSVSAELVVCATETVITKVEKKAKITLIMVKQI